MDILTGFAETVAKYALFQKEVSKFLLDVLTEFAETVVDYASDARTGFYLRVIYAVIIAIITISWCVSLFIEVTRKKASKLSIKYGSAGEMEKKIKKSVVKIVLQGILIAIAWAAFMILL